MNEAFLYYIWQYRLQGKRVQSTRGEELEIMKPGYRNPDAGPDYTEAMVRIGDEVWAGNIEIHLRTSDWFRHHHQNDRQYAGLILHVVYENDLPQSEPTSCPTLELKNHIEPSLWQAYQGFLLSKQWIPCGDGFRRVFPVVVHSMLERVMIERIERKVGEIQRLLQVTQNNLHESFYIALARAFGQKVNAQAFEILARTTPLHIIARYAHSLLQIEALLFGQAGMLSEQVVDDYHDNLFREYVYLKEKHHLIAALHIPWKFMRLRPYAFPSLRIAQLADLLHRSSGLLQKLLYCYNIDELKHMLSCQASGYWDTHYRLGETAPAQVKKAGEDFLNHLIINAIIPFQWIDARLRGDEKGPDRALELLYGLPPENNSIVRGWQQMGFKARDAFTSQALLELKNRYCSLKRCLNCKIGHSLLNMYA